MTPKDRLDDLRRRSELLVTTELDLVLSRHRLWWLVLVLLPAVVIGAGFGLFDIAAGALVACVVLLPVGAFPQALAPWVAVSALYLSTSLFTEVVSNNATAIVMTPLGIAIAHDLAVDPRPFVITVCFAASASFMTPVGYQTNMMVYGPGGYRFADFLRFGAPLNLLFWLVASMLIPVFWPF